MSTISDSISDALEETHPSDSQSLGSSPAPKPPNPAVSINHELSIPNTMQSMHSAMDESDKLSCSITLSCCGYSRQITYIKSENIDEADLEGYLDTLFGYCIHKVSKFSIEVSSPTPY